MLATRDDQIQELLDAENLDDVALRLNLRDIRRINALLGWTAFTARSVVQAARRLGRSSFTLLDVCSGSADIPLAIARQARRRGLRPDITATDYSAQIVAIARGQVSGYPEIRIEQCDALALPYAPGSFDIALCTLAMHHFSPDIAVEVLRNMGQVARHVMVFDALRDPLAYYGVQILTHLIPMHPMTRHDAPASVRRAYRAAEAKKLAERAGLSAIHAHVDFPFRLVLTADGPSPAEFASRL